MNATLDPKYRSVNRNATPGSPEDICEWLSLRRHLLPLWSSCRRISGSSPIIFSLFSRVHTCTHATLGNPLICCLSLPHLC